MSGLTEAQRSRFAPAIKRMDGDEELFVTMARMAAEDAPAMIETLANQLRSGDLSDAAHTGHALKGLLAAYETGVPVSDLQSIVDAARQGDAAVAMARFVDIELRLHRIVDEVRQAGEAK